MLSKTRIKELRSKHTLRGLSRWPGRLGCPGPLVPLTRSVPTGLADARALPANEELASRRRDFALRTEELGSKKVRKSSKTVQV